MKIDSMIFDIEEIEKELKERKMQEGATLIDNEHGGESRVEHEGDVKQSRV